MTVTFELAKRCAEASKEDFKERRAAVMAEAIEAGKSNRKAHRPRCDWTVLNGLRKYFVIREQRCDTYVDAMSKYHVE
ncbi:hypothetical protein KIN20_018770 [Parelaphostrongylus tenuis]|uniref:Uncharacterized protein n=1 Tax=Parelaphostrongylus tenuis TaxID=148309 RepID=A0AAD5N448_PARTN|nr:hypothetical protein KIN20_018770 [Parelaphostrongylus tenuis]